jgi:hypothetical protein
MLFYFFMLAAYTLALSFQLQDDGPLASLALYLGSPLVIRTHFVIVQSMLLCFISGLLVRTPISHVGTGARGMRAIRVRQRVECGKVEPGVLLRALRAPSGANSCHRA